MATIRIRRVRENAVAPQYAHPSDAGMDLFAAEDVRLGPGGRALVPTGWQVEVPRGYEMQVRPKSGLALRHGITLLNTPGTVDAGYRGEVGVILINTSDEPFELRAGQKVAQAVIARVEEAIVEEVEELSQTDRGEGGFGSTGLEARPQ